MTGQLLQVMFSPVIMLLLGGFAIAAALSKHYIAKAAATSILSKVSRPRNIVLATMFVATFASMWISNVAAPVLCFSLIQPILRRQTVDGEPLSRVCLYLSHSLHTSASVVAPRVECHHLVIVYHAGILIHRLPYHQRNFRYPGP
jgi:phosphate transporter